MRLKTTFVLAGLAMTALSAPAFAGGPCGARCYQKVVTPAQYGTVAETVMVRPAAVARHVTPAQYGTVAERVVVQPERTVHRIIPAVTQSVAEQVLVRPASKQWQVTRDAHGREIGCWVVVPAQYATQYRTVVVQPARTVAEIVPEVTAVRHRTVMTRPAQVHESVIPAQYATHHRTVQVAPASASWQPIR